MEFAVRTEKIRGLLTEFKNIGERLENISSAYRTASDYILSDEKCTKDTRSFAEEISSMFINGKKLIKCHCVFLNTGLEIYEEAEKITVNLAEELPEMSSISENRNAISAESYMFGRSSVPKVNFCRLDFNVEGSRLKIPKL